jgi:uncharacterized protein Smg (DUF494 family)
MLNRVCPVVVQMLIGDAGFYPENVANIFSFLSQLFEFRHFEICTPRRSTQNVQVI